MRSWPRVLAAVAVLLLAGAITMGVAAGYELRPRTWESSSTLRFTAPGVAATRIGARVDQVAEAMPFLTGPSSRRAEIDPEDVRADLAVQRVASDTLRLSASAATPVQVRRLVAAADELVLSAQLQAGVVVQATDPTRPVRTAPRLEDGLVVGAVASLAVALAALTARLAVSRRGR